MCSSGCLCTASWSLFLSRCNCSLGVYATDLIKQLFREAVLTHPSPRCSCYKTNSKGRYLTRQHGNRCFSEIQTQDFCKQSSIEEERSPAQTSATDYKSPTAQLHHLDRSIVQQSLRRNRPWCHNNQPNVPIRLTSPHSKISIINRAPPPCKELSMT